MDLQSEPVSYRQRLDPKIDLARCGATPGERAFLVEAQRRHNRSTDREYWAGQRVELNAMTSDLFVAWIDRRLAAHGVQKVIPEPDTLAQAYRRAVRTKAINAELVRLQATMTQQPIAVPDNLQARVRDLLRESPALSWDAAVWALVQGNGDNGSLLVS
jgi:hypothetical protein